MRSLNHPKQMKKKQTKLPDKPSALIRLALRDLEKCERSKRYGINMAEWHKPNGVCEVCLAGAVMAKTLSVPANVHLDPFAMLPHQDDSARKLIALDYFRCGQVNAGIINMGVTCGRYIGPERITNYLDNKPQFKKDMRKLAAMLAKEGL
jgi:hypothetical protein